MLNAEQLCVGYAGRAILGPLELALQPGRMVCLLGANGAGKSTLLRTLVGMQEPLAGRVLLDGHKLRGMSAIELARRLAVVLTDKPDVGALTGHDLVALGRYPHVGWTARLTDADREAVDQAMCRVGAQSLASRRVEQMSDGERQRIMLARALAQQPQVLVLDEITAFLDLPQRIETMHLLRRLAREQHLAILVSCHDLELALRFADQLWLIDATRGWHAGAPEDLVLDGSLAAAFARPGLRFDMELGEWHSESQTGTPIVLEGEGLTAIWTARALRRVGYEVAASAPLSIHAQPGSFRLYSNACEQRFASLGALLDALESGS